MSVRVVAGEIDTKDVTTRVAIPTASQGRWPPFERVAETIATPRRPFPPHRHAGVEVLTYVVEGLASYELGASPPSPLTSGSTVLLTCAQPTSHAINPGKGHTVRWFAVVASLPGEPHGSVRAQMGYAEATGAPTEGAMVRSVVGPGTALTSAIGLEAVAIEFASTATLFRKLGHDRGAVCYALTGRGRVDDQVLDAGKAALIEKAAGVAVQGQAGFQVVFVSAPRETESGPNVQVRGTGA